MRQSKWASISSLVLLGLFGGFVSMADDSVYLIVVRPEGLVISIQGFKVSDKLRKCEAFMEFVRFLSAFSFLCSVLLVQHLPSDKNSYFPPEYQLPWRAFHIRHKFTILGSIL